MINLNNLKYENDYELLYLVSENIEEANDLIYEKYRPVIDKYVKKYLPLVNNKGLEYNDLYQEGLIGLISAINAYKERKENKFSTFAFVCIERRIITAVKLASRQKHKILNDSYSLDYHDENSLSLNEIISSSDGQLLDDLVKNENEELFNNKLNKELTKLELDVYNLRLSGFSYEEIATMLKKSVKSVGSTIARIKLKIKKILDEIN